MNFSQGLQFLYPELILTFFAFGTLLAGVFTRGKNILGIMTFLGILLSAYCLPASFGSAPQLFSNMLANDSFSAFFRVLILVIAGMITLLSIGYKGLDEEDLGEYWFFLLSLTAAMMIAVSSNNLMMIYIALEGVSLISYIMAGYLKRDILSSEAGTKYFLFGALSTGVTLYGVSLVYGLFGTLDLSLIVESLPAQVMAHQPAVLLALALVIVGFCFKCSLVPFHMWTPDVYEGAPTPVAALLSVGPKAVGFAFILRVFVQNFQGAFLSWALFAGAIAVFTMTIGNIFAVTQNNIKRLLAYSTIAQAGYIFVGLAVATPAGVQSTLFYLFIYSIMNLGAFAVVIIVSNNLKSEAIEDYAGLYKRDPLSAVALTVSLLSLGGIPPLAGFLAKLFILAAAVEAQLTTLAVIVVLNSVVALYYYVRVVKFMFLNEPKNTQPISTPLAIQLVLIITLIGNIVFGVYPHPILDWLSNLLQLM